MTDTPTTSPDPLVKELCGAARVTSFGGDRQVMERAADRIDSDSELLRLADDLAKLAWTFVAYPQGLAGQNLLCGVRREDVVELREKSRAYRARREGEK